MEHSFLSPPPHCPPHLPPPHPPQISLEFASYPASHPATAGRAPPGRPHCAVRASLSELRLVFLYRFLQENLQVGIPPSLRMLCQLMHVCIGIYKNCMQQPAINCFPLVLSPRPTTGAGSGVQVIPPGFFQMPFLFLAPAAVSPHPGGCEAERSRALDPQSAAASQLPILLPGLLTPCLHPPPPSPPVDWRSTSALCWPCARPPWSSRRRRPS